MSEMRIYKKTALILCSVLMLSIVSAGCSDQGNNVTSPQNIKYFVENNVEIETISEEFENGFGEYIQISGLKDKDVEEKVNGLLLEAYTEIKENDELPPYRGIRQKVKEGDDIEDHYIYTSVGANVNNILSLYIMENVSSENNKGEPYYYSDVKTVNLDLNTGNEIPLQDVFCNDVDYEAYLNEYVEKASFGSSDMESGYYASENTLKLTAPFNGITEDQKFYINQYDGSLQLIFDYEQPEVYCEYDSPVFFKADLGENSALAVRYYDEKECLYEEDTKRAFMISKPFDVTKAVSSDSSIGIGGEAGEYQIWVSTIYYEDMPAGALKYAKEHSGPEADMVQAYMSALEGYGETYSEEGISSDAFYHMDCSRFADLTNVSTVFSASIYSSDGTQLSLLTDNVYSCFKAAEYKPLNIEDVFVSKEDAKEIVTKAFMKNYEDYIETEGNGALFADKAQMERFFNEAYDKMNGFMTAGSFILFSYDGWDLLLDKYFPGEDNYIYGSFCEMAEYEYLGVENLTIF